MCTRKQAHSSRSSLQLRTLFHDISLPHANRCANSSSRANCIPSINFCFCLSLCLQTYTWKPALALGVAAIHVVLPPFSMWKMAPSAQSRCAASSISSCSKSELNFTCKVRVIYRCPFPSSTTDILHNSGAIPV